MELTGLTQSEARKKLIHDGYNELQSEKPKTIFHFILEIVREPMILLLIISASIYYFLGDPKEGTLLLFFVLFVAGITIYQERKTEKSLEALRNLSSPRALVIRDGNTLRIPGREVVKDDLLILNEGDRIPADAIVLEAINLSVDESLLTGESMAVTKTVWQNEVQERKPGGDNLPYVFSGTLIIKGHGFAQVVETGARTEMGKIGKALMSVRVEKTGLQKEIGLVVRNLAIIGISLSMVLVILYGFLRGNWLAAILAGITMAMSILPEEFPIILTIFLALGAWRLSRKKVLARRTAVIETLGSATVLCVDKTGTLTENRMSIAEITTTSSKFTHDEFKNGAAHEIIYYSVLSSQIKPFDPMEIAFINAGREHLNHFSTIYNDIKLIKEYPLEKTSLCVVQAWQQINSEDFLVAAKGSPEAILHLCHLPEEKHKEIYAQVDSMAKQGLRVIAVAKATYSEKELPHARDNFNFEYLGIIGLEDPVRPEAAEAVKLCYSAGIRVIMVTGDYAETAHNIAHQIGLTSHQDVITGEDLRQMNPQELAQKIKTNTIFSRVVPEQKLMIIEALKRDGEIVAMTGDGVNDAPALKAAHIGVAMGERGTDVAREAAAIVILDDNFSSIVNAVKLGRRIYDNLVKAVTYTLAVHVPVAGLSLVPVFFGWPLILLPVHIVFLELVIDPTCTIVFEAEPADEDIMKRKPRNANLPIINRETLFISLIQGANILIVSIIAYLLASHWHFSTDKTRAFVFVTLIFANLFLLATSRSWTKSIFRSILKRSLSFYLITIATLFFLLLTVLAPNVNPIFKFEPLNFIEFLYCFVLAALTIVWFELYKWYKHN